MNIDEKLIETFTLFMRHMFMLEQHYKKQQKIMRKFENKYAETRIDTFSEIVNLYNYVIYFLDIAYKIKKISSKIPKVSQKSKEYRIFNQNTESLRNIRDSFQHINNDVPLDIESHILGTISWFRGNRIYNISFQDISRTKNGHTIPFEVTEENKLKINHGFSFIRNNDTYDCDAIFEACKKLSEHLASMITLTENNGKIEIDLRKKFDVWCIEFEQVDGGVKYRRC